MYIYICWQSSECTSTFLLCPVKMSMISGGETVIGLDGGSIM